MDVACKNVRQIRLRYRKLAPASWTFDQVAAFPRRHVVHVALRLVTTYV